MAESVYSTYKILKEKAFNTDVDESWIIWAMEMIQAGHDADSLYQLAGISKPYNQFELQSLANKVFDDLDLDYSDTRKVINDYAYHLIKSNLNKTEMYFNVLREFRDIYYQLDMDSEFYDFVSLFWAKDDLLYSDIQYYWDGADKTNIDSIITAEFEKYITEFENGQ